MNKKTLILAATLFFVVLCLAFPVVHGQATNSTSTSPPPFDFASFATIQTLGYSAPVALVIAIASSLAGYLESNPPEDFSLAKFLYTALLSFVVAFVTMVLGVDYTQVLPWLANGFMTWYLWKLSNIIANYIQAHWPGLKPATANATSTAKPT